MRPEPAGSATCPARESQPTSPANVRFVPGRGIGAPLVPRRPPILQMGAGAHFSSPATVCPHLTDLPPRQGPPWLGSLEVKRSAGLSVSLAAPRKRVLLGKEP